MTSQTSGDKQFAFIIPVFNHPLHIERIVADVSCYNCPVIVVDDGSTDETSSLLLTLPNIVLLSHEKNRGKGAALLTGLNHAGKIADWAITIDADGQHNPKDASSLMELASKNPDAIIIGKREGMSSKHIPWTSRYGRCFSNFWVFASCGSRLSDSQSGFRLYPLRNHSYSKIHSGHYQFEFEVLVKARWGKIPIIETPISVYYPPKGVRISHFRPFVDFMRYSAVFTWMIAQRLLVPPRFRRTL